MILKYLERAFEVKIFPGLEMLGGWNVRELKICRDLCALSDCLRLERVAE